MAGTNVVMKTSAGDIKIELFTDTMPVTAGNFLALALDGYYDGLGIDNPNKPDTYDAETLATPPEGWTGGAAAWNALNDEEKTEYLNA